jgi:hypothetical protein
MFKRIGKSWFQERGAIFGKCEIIQRITGVAEPEMFDAKLTILVSDDTYDPTITKIANLTGWIEATINHDAYLPRTSQYLTHHLEKVMLGARKESHSTLRFVQPITFIHEWFASPFTSPDSLGADLTVR